MSKAIKNFENALQRLIDGKPSIVKPPYTINNDTVALEAGRKRGAIKKSRPELAELLVAIAEAEARRTGKSETETVDIRDSKLQEAQERIKELETQLAELQDKYDKQLAQLNIQMYRNMQFQKQLQGGKNTESNLLDFMKN
ncbi:hypothetical protein [Acinetobacter sp. ANC 5378]|uniref:hypothetical protein n=1 Tax=Acinetobacter sp. ANC 5378 TaxID=2731249 RepID=UPI00148FE5CA|nr:hypothetical protein [Acinetobacter sp. ANC 5378]NNG82920.1 hypothetical protein [Acinetobacter sp. ANC 5378]